MQVKVEIILYGTSMHKMIATAKGISSDTLFADSKTNLLLFSQPLPWKISVNGDRKDDIKPTTFL
jgi:hypothetical protein